ncbi:sensor histidine kinase [Halorubrum sp. FL23]|uniref:sensor histidine kinase n=1 Tax=Halorubrum sp. FL23 TaxID=3458704 RepID=UPI0040338A3C
MGPPSGGRLRRWLAGGSISLLGAILLVIPLYDVWDDFTALSWSIALTLVENALFFLLAGGLVTGGIWLIRTDWETEQVTTVARRTLLTAFAVTFVLAWAMALQWYILGRLKPIVLALDGVLVGATASFALSVSTVRNNIFREQISREQELNERLELLYEDASRLASATSHEEAYEVLEEAIASAVPGTPFRVVVDGDVVIEHDTSPDPSERSEPAQTVAIGDRGRIDLCSERLESHELSTAELFGSYVGDTIQRIEREERVREERNVLEFVNRTLRHDLIGDISLVQARLRMLDRNVEFEADVHEEHLAVAMDRTEEMEEFVRTMRTYMQSVLNEEHDLTTVALEPVIDEQIEAIEEAYPTVEVEKREIPEGSVRADDLLDRALANLFENAVEHNDASPPRVVIDGERAGDVLRLRVADNGPGISASRRESVFAQEERGANSDGTGFGLYLVKDIIEGYGGTVRVRDNDPRGAVFELEFPIADGE